MHHAHWRVADDQGGSVLHRQACRWARGSSAQDSYNIHRQTIYKRKNGLGVVQKGRAFWRFLGILRD